MSYHKPKKNNDQLVFDYHFSNSFSPSPPPQILILFHISMWDVLLDQKTEINQLCQILFIHFTYVTMIQMMVTFNYDVMIFLFFE